MKCRGGKPPCKNASVFLQWFSDVPARNGVSHAEGNVICSHVAGPVGPDFFSATGAVLFPTFRSEANLVVAVNMILITAEKRPPAPRQRIACGVWEVRI
jgi:hypothetical protein